MKYIFKFIGFWILDPILISIIWILTLMWTLKLKEANAAAGREWWYWHH